MNSDRFLFTKKALLLAGLIAGPLLLWAIFLKTPAKPKPPQPFVAKQQVLSPAVREPLAVVQNNRQESLRPIPPFATATQSSLRLIDTSRPSPTPAPVIYVIQAGDILGKIAETFGATVEEIQEVNHGLDPLRLQIGQELIIPVTVTPSPTPGASPSPTSAPVTYIVQPGDILLEIAAQYETTVEAIVIANKITNVRALQVGQTLVIPPDKGSILGVPTVLHEVEAGDTFSSLSTRYGSTLEDILASNPDVEPTALQIGQRVIIPLTQPRFNPKAIPQPPRLTNPLPSTETLLALEQEMLKVLNVQRQIQGLLPYPLDETLTLVARAHAQDMVTRGYFSHVTLEGITVQERVETQAPNFEWVGENIQRNTQPADDAVQYALDWFMGSRPHRNNILHQRFDRIGLGVAEGPVGWYTFVLVFGGD